MLVNIIMKQIINAQFAKNNIALLNKIGTILFNIITNNLI